MNINEVATMFGIENRSKVMKNKEKAKEIIDKILKCPKCGKQMKWIGGTNVCVCSTCTYSIDEKENKKSYSISKILQEKSRNFLENNIQYITVESAEV